MQREGMTTQNQGSLVSFPPHFYQKFTQNRAGKIFQSYPHIKMKKTVIFTCFEYTKMVKYSGVNVVYETPKDFRH